MLTTSLLLLLILPSYGCESVPCEITTTTIEVPGDDCTTGRCAEWRTGPCQAACSAFIEGGWNYETVSCTPPAKGASGRYQITCNQRSTGTCTKGPVQLGALDRPALRSAT